MTTTQPLPPVVDRETWQRERDRLLVQEKALMRLKDGVSAARRRLPMVQVRADYRFEGPDGSRTLLELFDGRSQLIVQHVMFAADWDEACDGCAMMTDHIGPLAHLHARDTSFVMVSTAPVTSLVGFAERMGWQLPWFSCGADTFNQDFGATDAEGGEQQAVSVFLTDGERVFHTWSTYDRGEEPFMVVFDLLDLTPYGRQETWEDSPEGWPQDPPYAWWRLHDSYGDRDGCAHHP